MISCKKLHMSEQMYLFNLLLRNLQTFSSESSESIVRDRPMEPPLDRESKESLHWWRCRNTRKCDGVSLILEKYPTAFHIFHHFERSSDRASGARLLVSGLLGLLTSCFAEYFLVVNRRTDKLTLGEEWQIISICHICSIHILTVVHSGNTGRRAFFQNIFR